MRFKPLIALVLGSVAAWQLTAPRTDKRSPEGGSEGRKPREEHRWENEGGALPVSGAQLGPSPELPA